MSDNVEKRFEPDIYIHTLNYYLKNVILLTKIISNACLFFIIFDVSFCCTICIKMLLCLISYQRNMSRPFVISST